MVVKKPRFRRVYQIGLNFDYGAGGRLCASNVGTSANHVARNVGTGLFWLGLGVPTIAHGYKWLRAARLAAMADSAGFYVLKHAPAAGPEAPEAAALGAALIITGLIISSLDPDS